MNDFLAIIERNHAAIRDRMAAAARRAGRSAESVRLVAVTKTVGVDAIRALLDLGVTELGENRVELARPKIEVLTGTPARWHMIGSVQRRKAKDVAACFDFVDAVDRVELAEALQRRCEELDRRLHILIEVNVSGEVQKHGFAPVQLEGALRALAAYDRLRVDGLMTMAPLDAPEAVVRSVFGGLRQQAQRLGLPELSMGMSGDFEIAIEEGATQVRIGAALFETTA